MSTILPAPAARQTAVVAAIAVLHVGAFLAVTLRPAGPFHLPDVSPGVFFVPPPPIAPTLESPPAVAEPGDYQPETVKEPVVVISVVDEEAKDIGDLQSNGDGGAAQRAPRPVPDFRGPQMRTRDARLQALIDACYPSAARRRNQEGRGVARVVVDTAGRASAWSVEQSTGFKELDPAMGCVARRVQFEPGRRDGRAIEATVLMPMNFQLH